MRGYNIKPIADYEGMTAEELLQKYRIVTYSKGDVSELNEALEVINRITRKYERKMNERNGTGKRKAERTV